MDEKRLRELAGVENLNEAFDANGMLGDMREIDAEFKADRKRVRALLRHIAQGDRRNAQIAADFLTDFLGVIFADQERGKQDELR